MRAAAWLYLTGTQVSTGSAGAADVYKSFFSKGGREQVPSRWSSFLGQLFPLQEDGGGKQAL